MQAVRPNDYLMTLPKSLVSPLFFLSYSFSDELASASRFHYFSQETNIFNQIHGLFQG